MSFISFLSASFLMLVPSMSPPAGNATPAAEATPVQIAQNSSARSMTPHTAPNEAPTQLALDTPITVGGVETVCTGIDSDARENPRWLTYPLRVEFAAGKRAYIADERVSISGAKEGVLLDVHCKAPWLLAKLAPGKYQIEATIPRGATQKVKVSVPASGQKRVVLHFPEVPAAESSESGDQPGGQGATQ